MSNLTGFGRNRRDYWVNKQHDQARTHGSWCMTGFTLPLSKGESAHLRELQWHENEHGDYALDLRIVLSKDDLRSLTRSLMQVVGPDEVAR